MRQSNTKKIDKQDKGHKKRKGRNEGKNVKKEFGIKKFIKITNTNRIKYNCLRKTKEQRSYEISANLRLHGGAAPSEIAYIEIKKGRILQDCYFIYHFSDFTPLDKIFCLPDMDVDRELIKKVAYYIADLHKRGIIHYDLNPTNILYRETENGIEFQLIDINRIKFKGDKIKTNVYVRNLIRMGLEYEWFKDFISYYEEAMGFQSSTIYKKVMRFAAQRELHLRTKHFLKNLVLLRFLR